MRAKLVNEAIKHLSPISKEEVRKKIHELFGNLTSTNLGEKLQFYRDKSNNVDTRPDKSDMYKELIFQYEKMAEVMDSDISDIEFIEDGKNEFLMFDNFFEVLSYKQDKRINLPFELGVKINVYTSEGYSRGLFHVYPEIKIAYMDADNYNNAWYFDFPYLMKNLDKCIDIFTKEKMNESYDYFKTHLQIYSNNDPNDFFNYIVLKGNDLFNVRLVKGEHWQWKYIGQIDKNKYIVNGKLISKPSMKLITIFQKNLKPHEISTRKY